MIDKAVINNLFEAAVKDDPALFLIDVVISPDNNITVIADGEKGISINDCIAISRHIEKSLNEEDLDFSLEVTSPGAAEPFTDKRQYKKNIGRTLKVVSDNEKYEGVLTAITDNDITLEWESREPKPVGKGKITVKKTKVIPYELINSAKVKIKI